MGKLAKSDRPGGDCTVQGGQGYRPSVSRKPTSEQIGTSGYCCPNSCFRPIQWDSTLWLEIVFNGQQYFTVSFTVTLVIGEISQGQCLICEVIARSFEGEPKLRKTKCKNCLKAIFKHEQQWFCAAGEYGLNIYKTVTLWSDWDVMQESFYQVEDEARLRQHEDCDCLTPLLRSRWDHYCRTARVQMSRSKFCCLGIYLSSR